ncbi:unnamed protein product [Closterium sp. Naga37s-1]|nr:unnamed protein product [Closterium sp. Naga37s-1]
MTMCALQQCTHAHSPAPTGGHSFKSQRTCFLPLTYLAAHAHIAHPLPSHLTPLSRAPFPSPMHMRGFSPHYDDIDAFVLQVEGCKRWRCYQGVKGEQQSEDGEEDEDEEESAGGGGRDGEGEDGEGAAGGEEGLLPRFSSRDFRQQELLQPPILDVVLRPGDLLYMPRGIIHQAEAVDDQHSLHLTISASQRNTMADFLHLALPRAIEVAAEEHVLLRHSLPRDLFDFMGVMHAPPLPDAPEHTHSNGNSDIDAPAHADGTSLAAAPAGAAEAGGDLRRAAFLQRMQQAVQLVAACGPWDSAADQMASAFLRSRLPPFRASTLSASAPSASQQAQEGGGRGGGKGGGAAGKGQEGKVHKKSRVRVSVEGGCRLVVEDGVAVVYHMMDNRREVHNKGEDSGMEKGEEKDDDEARMSAGAEKGAATTDQAQVNPEEVAMCVEDKEDDDEDEEEGEEGASGEGRLEFELQWAELLEELVQLEKGTALGPLLKRLSAAWEGPAAAATAGMLSVVQVLVDHGVLEIVG